MGATCTCVPAVSGRLIGRSSAIPERTSAWVMAKYANGYTDPRLVARVRVGNAAGSVMVSGWG